MHCRRDHRSKALFTKQWLSSLIALASWRDKIRENYECPSKGLPFLTMQQLCDAGFTAVAPAGLIRSYQIIADWVRTFLMREHPDLGRSGDVCPFTTQAVRLDTVRISMCAATSVDISVLKAAMRRALREFAAIPCRQSMRHFRAVIVGFPNINDASGLAALKKVQKQLNLYCLLRGIMIARFHPEADDPGLWNPQFRPLRAPIPMSSFASWWRTMRLLRCAIRCFCPPMWRGSAAPERHGCCLMTRGQSPHQA